MEFKDVLGKYKFEWDGFVFTLKESQDNYIVKYEGYAYVLYKEIFICSENTLEPIAHFRDAKRMDIFLEILFEKFDKDGWKGPEQITHTLEGVIVDFGKGNQFYKHGDDLNQNKAVRDTLEGTIIDFGSLKPGEVKEVNIDQSGKVIYPDYVCIKDDEMNGIKRGSILRISDI